MVVELNSGNVLKLAEGQRADGEFCGIDPSAQFKDSYALKLKQADGIKVIFVSNIVKDLLSVNNVQPGARIGVLFKGLKDNKSKTARYKDYAVFLL